MEPTATSSPEEVAAAYFEAWRAGDAEQVRPLLAPDVDFVGALGVANGVDECVAGLRAMFAMTERVEVVRRWIDGADVITWFELTTATAGPVAIVNWSHVVYGLITRIRVTFDPRPIIGS
ncbi:MAG: nuclear transport factor 2 family protein [Acidimicrobiales bacterium]